MSARRHLMDSMRALYGDHYQGQFVQAIAQPQAPATLLHHRAVDGAILAAINDRGTLRLLRLETIDHPELMRLGDRDRAMLQGALGALLRQLSEVRNVA